MSMVLREWRTDMHTLQCPWCGIRDLNEFSCGGEADIVRPDVDVADDAKWGDYLYFRTNTKGEQVELWCHQHGCRQWFRVTRNTANHQIISVSSIEPRRDASGG
jgi:sarcosine oxidase subunit delta